MKGKRGRKPHKGLETLANAALIEMPETPEAFSPEEARRFRAYCAELVQRGILFPTDIFELERLVLLETEAAKLLTEIAQEGALVEDKNQDKRRSPAVMAYGNISAEIGNIRKLLALGPAYRNKLPGKEPADVEKEMQKAALEAEIREKYGPKEAALILKGITSPTSTWHRTFPAHLRKAVDEYRELMGIDEFDI